MALIGRLGIDDDGIGIEGAADGERLQRILAASPRWPACVMWKSSVDGSSVSSQEWRRGCSVSGRCQGSVARTSARDVGPGLLQLADIAGLVLGEVVGHRPLAGQAPDHRPGAVAGDEVAPMRRHPLLAHEQQVIAPAAEDAGHDALFDEVLEAAVGGLEEAGIDARVAFEPQAAAGIGVAAVEGRRIGLEADDDLRDGKPCSKPLRRQRLEAVGPGNALAGQHPPGVGKPVERRAVGMLEYAACPRRCAPGRGGRADWPRRRRRRHLHDRLAPGETGIAAIAAFGREPPGAGRRQCDAEAPDTAAIPVSGDTQHLAARPRRHGGKHHLAPGIAAVAIALERPHRAAMKRCLQPVGHVVLSCRACPFADFPPR